MTDKRAPGLYYVGRNKPDVHINRQTGLYGVVKGSYAMECGQIEWRHFCEGALHSSKWFAFQFQQYEPDGTVLLKPFDTKQAAVDWLLDRYGSKFTDVY